MRNLLWRGLAVALAACIGLILWRWPAPAEPVEFNLRPACSLLPGVTAEPTIGGWRCVRHLGYVDGVEHIELIHDVTP